MGPAVEEPVSVTTVKADSVGTKGSVRETDVSGQTPTTSYRRK